MDRRQRQKKETDKKPPVKKTAREDKEKSDHDSTNPDYGGIPARDLKKNLGCG